MLPNVPTQFRVNYKRSVYCPCCSVQLNDEIATVQHGWWICLQCAFQRNTEDPIFVRATEFKLIYEHVSVARGLFAYTPKPPIHRAIPIVELVTLETVYGNSDSGQLID